MSNLIPGRRGPIQKTNEIKIEDRNPTQEMVDTAVKYAEFAWYDVMIGFKEIGYDPSSQEKQRIMESLFKSKIKNLMKKGNW